MSDIEPLTIAFLPIVKNPRLTDVAVPEDKILDTAISETRWVGIRKKNVKRVTAAELAAANVELQFPLTPERVAAAAASLKVGAAVGISVATATEARPQQKEKAEMELFISFAEASDSPDRPPQKKWTLSGSWYGSNLRSISSSFLGVGFHFIDLKFWAED